MVSTIVVQAASGHTVLISSMVLEHIKGQHAVSGKGSVFARVPDVNEFMKAVQSLDITKPDADGLYEVKIKGIGYDLVRDIKKARGLKGARERTAIKEEMGGQVSVPAIKTSLPMKEFMTDVSTLVIRPTPAEYIPEDVKNDEMLGLAARGRIYSVLTMWPGRATINGEAVPPASQWKGKYAVIIPMNDELSELFEKSKENGGVPITLFDHGKPVDAYIKIIRNIEQGVMIKFSNGQIFTIKKVLGQGRTTRVVTVKESEYENWAVRLNMKTNPEYINEMLEREPELNQLGKNIVRLDERRSLKNEYCLVEILKIEFELHDYLSDYCNLGSDEIDNYIIEFAKVSARFSFIGDFKSKQLAFVKGRGWVLVDYTQGNRYASRVNDSTLFDGVFDEFVYPEYKESMGNKWEELKNKINEVIHRERMKYFVSVNSEMIDEEVSERIKEAARADYDTIRKKIRKDAEKAA
ncbi:MAG: hypothetical protein JW789_02220 [Candidatus Aenigmarchaeota archaeon]|nr:hypothetical protein [Candidatus Aenigmarchaeota archaeon]